MNLTQTNKVDQPQFKRTEYAFELTFSGATPKRADIKNTIVNHTKSKPEMVIVTQVKPTYGHEKVGVTARVYKDKESLDTLESDYMKKRNFKEEKKEEKAEEAPAATPAEEPKAEEAPKKEAPAEENKEEPKTEEEKEEAPVEEKKEEAAEEKKEGE